MNGECESFAYQQREVLIPLHRKICDKIKKNNR